ncbi:heavy metal translocating P-type ATPase [Desulfobulbus alkaliphilus]|nr:heavy metal translocating P-type ATPase [Desulfobulbus alkaliphilus]
MIPPTAAITVAHELERRLRLRCRLLTRRNINPAYVEAGLESIPGVTEVRINTSAACIVVNHDGTSATRKAILTYLATLPGQVMEEGGREKNLLSALTLVVRGGLALSLLILPPPFKIPVAIFLALPVLGKGLLTLWSRGIKVEVLDAAAVLFCLARHDYFTAASIVFLLSAGEYLQNLSEDRTTGLLKSLLKPRVETIWIEVDGQEVEIPFDQARIGDRVICGAGEMIPLDGIVAEGEASVNAGSITGESVPVHVQPGDEVLSGSVVENGRILFIASHVGAATSMARISTFLENSLRNESEAQRESDRLADRLVPVTFGLGLGLLAVTRDLEKAAAVLTVDYSCVIKLAHPVAVRVAMFSAVSQGVLLKGAGALDALAGIDTLVFDKTGTLTRGRLLVTDIHPLATMSEEELLTLAAGAEVHYSHPVAAAVVAAARDRELTLPPTSQVDFIVAHGVSAYIHGTNILVGSRHFIEDDEGISCQAADLPAAALEEKGNTLLYVARDGHLIGIIALRDEPRPEAEQVLHGLKATGINNIIILTGDTERTARALAARLPAVDEVHWELKPEDKAGIIRRMQEQGHRIGFIGDGVNDAPALVSAEVGICLPNGAELARESAQVLLLRDDLSGLLTGRLVALRTRETIRSTFYAAIGLNSTFLLLASFGLIRPIAAALLHNLSTVGILGFAGLRGRTLPEQPDMPAATGSGE